MLIYKTKTFARFARGEGLADASLIQAIEQVERGLIDAVLGGGLIKQRVARAGQGSRGGFRAIIAYRTGDTAVFLYGYAKRDRKNIAGDEEDAYRQIGGLWLSDKDKIEKDLKSGTLMEVKS